MAQGHSLSQSFAATLDCGMKYGFSYIFTVSYGCITMLSVTSSPVISFPPMVSISLCMQLYLAVTWNLEWLCSKHCTL